MANKDQIRQQQAQTDGEGKEGTQGEKGCYKAARPLARPQEQPPNVLTVADGLAVSTFLAAAEPTPRPRSQTAATPSGRGIRQVAESPTELDH